MSNQSWEARIAEARAAGAPIFQKNGLPIVCQRGFDGALLEHEHADHPDYKFPVDVEYTESKEDFFHAMCVAREEKPVHYDHEVKWTLEHETKHVVRDGMAPDSAFCVTCDCALTQADIVHQRAYSVAESNEAQYEPHSEALIYYDESIAVTLHECCYTMWHRRDGGYLHGPSWSKHWKLTAEAMRKIWPSAEVEEKNAEVCG